MLFKFFALSFLVLGAQAQDSSTPTSTKCSDLPNLYINYTALQAYSPYLVLRSLDPDYKCTSALLTGPGPTNNGNYTWVILQNNVIKNVAAVYKKGDENSTMFETCKNGTDYEYKFAVWTNTYFITYICSPGQDQVSLLRGYGHNADDGMAIDQYLATLKLNYAGGGTVTDMTTKCEEDKYCTDFYF